MTDRPSWDDLPDATTALLMKRELSAITGLSPKIIERLVRDGMPTIHGDTARAPHKYILKDCIAWMVQERVAPVDTLSQARQRKAEAEAERLEQQNAQRSGDLVSRSEKNREITEGMAELRSHLVTIPARMTYLADEDRARVKADIVVGVNEFAKKVQHVVT